LKGSKYTISTGVRILLIVMTMKYPFRTLVDLNSYRTTARFATLLLTHFYIALASSSPQYRSNHPQTYCLPQSSSVLSQHLEYSAALKSLDLLARI
jgi:hypothetical protein